MSSRSISMTRLLQLAQALSVLTEPSAKTQATHNLPSLYRCHNLPGLLSMKKSKEAEPADSM